MGHARQQHRNLWSDALTPSSVSAPSSVPAPSSDAMSLY